MRQSKVPNFCGSIADNGLPLPWLPAHEFKRLFA